MQLHIFTTFNTVFSFYINDNITITQFRIVLNTFAKQQFKHNFFYFKLKELTKLCAKHKNNTDA